MEKRILRPGDHFFYKSGTWLKPTLVELRQTDGKWKVFWTSESNPEGWYNYWRVEAIYKEFVYKGNIYEDKNFLKEDLFTL